MAKKFDYRKYYIDYYKMFYPFLIDENYVVHHIDFNRNNNDIENLLLLPRNLHFRYHKILRKLWTNGYNLSLSLKLIPYQQKEGMDIYYISELVKVLEEIDYWVKEKSEADYWIGQEKLTPDGYPMFFGIKDGIAQWKHAKHINNRCVYE